MESQFLTLPVELRLRIWIYGELLCPDPLRVYQLYHDREGRGKAFDIHPAILRVNKEIYHQAINLLYEHNIFEISLCTPLVPRSFSRLRYSDSLPNPPDLIRRDAIPSVTEYSGHTETLRASLANDREDVIDCTRPGIISPHGLQRLRHIRLTTSQKAIWGSVINEYRITYVGASILDILGCLVKEALASKTKVLEFVVVPHWLNWRGLFHPDFRRSALIEIAGSLNDIQRTRVVKVEESTRTSRQGTLEKKQVDIKHFLASVTL